MELKIYETKELVWKYRVHLCPDNKHKYIMSSKRCEKYI